MFQKTTVFAIREYAIDQKFRLCSRIQVSAVASTIVSSIGGGGVSDASLLPLISRIEDLEDGQEPFVLGINENGDLEQTGMTSGNFDVDENGVLNFEDN